MDSVSVLLSWVNLVGNDYKKQWIMLFFSLLWSVWLYRNKMVFDGIHWDLIQLLNTIKCRFAYWFHAKWPENGGLVVDILREYDEVKAKQSDKRNRGLVTWLLPAEGHVKFNVDGSAMRKPGPAGVGGILRDHKGNVLAIFSKSIGSEDSNAAELVAITEAFQMFVNSRWVNQALIVENDSKNAVLWVNRPEETPWRLRNLSDKLSNLKQGVAQWQCTHIYREANVDADQLVRQGVNRERDLVSFLL